MGFHEYHGLGSAFASRVGSGARAETYSLLTVEDAEEAELDPFQHNEQNSQNGFSNFVNSVRPSLTSVSSARRPWWRDCGVKGAVFLLIPHLVCVCIRPWLIELKNLNKFSLNTIEEIR
jgi:hypothetical protein